MASTHPQKLFGPVMLLVALAVLLGPSVGLDRTSGSWTGLEAPTAAAAAPPSALLFEPNRGQATDEVRFVGRASGSQIHVLARGFRLVHVKPPPVRSGASRTPAAVSAVSMRVVYRGARKNARIEGEAPQASRSHYIRARGSGGDVLDVPHFARVVQHGIYPGIDAVLYGRNGAVEYDFRVAPGADPGRIRLAFPGADRIDVDARGALRVRVGSETFRHLPPVCYQEAAGVREPVEGRWVVHEDEAQFKLSVYDTGRMLVIDPVISYASFHGGPTQGSQSAEDCALGPDGHFYVAGYTSSLDFPTTPGVSQQLKGSIYFDAFVTRFGPDGLVVWSTYLGGSDQDLAYGMDVDASGVYVCGFTASPDFPTTGGAYKVSMPSGCCAMFVTKLHLDGSVLLWSTLYGAADETGTCWDVAVDSQGAVAMAGITTSQSLPVMKPHQPLSGGQNDAFVAKLAADGASLIFSTYLGGSSEDEVCRSVAIGPSDDVYVTGWTASPDFPLLSAFQPLFASAGADEWQDRDAFVARYDATGALLYSSYLGGSRLEESEGVAVDAQGRAWVVGSTRSSDFPLRGEIRKLKGRQPPRDVFLVQVSADGLELLYSTTLGGNEDEYGNAIVLGQDLVHVTGNTGTSQGFPIVDGVQCSYAGNGDGFVMSVPYDGSHLAFSTLFGGGNYEEPNAIVEDAQGRLFVTGRTQSGDFPYTDDAEQPVGIGAHEAAFVVILDLASPGGCSDGGKGGGKGGNGGGKGKPK